MDATPGDVDAIKPGVTQLAISRASLGTDLLGLSPILFPNLEVNEMYSVYMK